MWGVYEGNTGCGVRICIAGTPKHTHETTVESCVHGSYMYCGEQSNTGVVRGD
jgi:hypothetical protein